MICSDSLPLYFKRIAAVFLVCTASYLIFARSGNQMHSDEPKNSINTVVIDAGHGGKDPGAVGKKSKEKDLALKIALKLGYYIEENFEDVKVIYTRKTDVYPTLKERADIANKNEADLFISVHVNANNKTSPYGTSTHVLGINQTGKNLETAIRENSVIMLEEDYETTYQGFDPKSPESYVIFSLMANTFQKQSIEFGYYVQSQFRERAGRHDRGVIQQPLLVLSLLGMPGVLIETGFISNLKEEKYLMTNEGQELIASAIYRAFKQYKSRIEERSNFTVEPIPDPVKLADVEQSTDKKIYFRVQIASSKNKVSTEPSSFKGHADVSVIDQGRWFKYTIGRKLNYNEALDRCDQVKNDFPGSFVIAVRNNEIIPLSEALIEINR
jgi:N-acetylmuramoyl-L-alanine amidase